MATLQLQATQEERLATLQRQAIQAVPLDTLQRPDMERLATLVRCQLR